MFLDSERPKEPVRNTQERLGCVRSTNRLYYAGLSIFVAANIADLLTTNTSMQFGSAVEMNPFMRPFIEQLGLTGAVLAKAAATTLAIVFAEAIRRRNHPNLSIKTLRGINILLTSVAITNLLQTSL